MNAGQGQLLVKTDGTTVAKDIRSMNLMEKIAAVESIYVGYPRFETLLNKIEFCQKVTAISADPECVFIKGSTGAGKSTLADQHLLKYPREKLPKPTRVPVLFVWVPVRATHHNLVEELLIRIGDPAAAKGNTHQKTSRFKGYLKDYGVELIILNEFQRVYDKDTNYFIEATSDWLISLIEETRVPAVLLGLPEAEDILNSNEQLSRRFADRCWLAPFATETKDQLEEIKTFLYLVENQCPLLDHSALNSEDMARRICYATDGVAGYIMTLVRKGVRLALMAGIERLDLDILAQAFDLYILKEKPYKINPFIDEKFTKKAVEDLTKKEATKEDFGGISKKLKARKTRQKTTKDVF